MITLDMQDVIKTVGELNQDAKLLHTDFILDRMFPAYGKPLEPNKLGSIVSTLDRQMATQLFWQAGALESITSNLEKNVQGMNRQLARLGPHDFRQDPDKVYSLATELFPIILDLGKHHNQNYSFTTKFFHWCTRQHFPIVDKHSRRAISNLQSSEGVDSKTRIKISGDNAMTYIEEYRKWVDFYSSLLNSLSDHDSNELLETDISSQRRTAEHLMVNSSILRVLDKYFFMKGYQSISEKGKKKRSEHIVESTGNDS